MRQLLQGTGILTTLRAHLHLLLCVLEYPEPDLLVEQIVDLPTVDLKEASTDCQILFGVLWEAIQPKHISSWVCKTRTQQ